MVACKPLLLAGDRFVNLNIDASNVSKFCQNYMLQILRVLGKYTDPTDPVYRPNYFLKLGKYTDNSNSFIEKEIVVCL